MLNCVHKFYNYDHYWNRLSGFDVEYHVNNYSKTICGISLKAICIKCQLTHVTCVRIRFVLDQPLISDRS